MFNSIEIVEKTFNHLDVNPLARGEVWISSEVIQSNGFNNDIEGHLRFASPWEWTSFSCPCQANEILTMIGITEISDLMILKKPYNLKTYMSA